MAADAPDALPTGPHRAGRDPLRLGLLAGSLLCLLLVGLAHPSVAAPPLGPAGWVPHLPDLPLGGWVVVALQVAGYALGAAALLRGLRVPSRLDIPWAAWALVGGLVLLTVPYGTADHTNYAAYGHILVEGGDPWVTTPQDFGPDRITSAVQPPWEDTPSVYGPVATGLMGLSALVGGELPRQVVWVWQVLVVAAWLIARALLLGLTGDRESVDTWWTGNVLVLGAGVLGAHVDLLATTALVGALLATRVRGVPGALLAGALAGVAASTKITAGVVVVVLAWLYLRRDMEIGPQEDVQRADLHTSAKGVGGSAKGVRAVTKGVGSSAKGAAARVVAVVLAGLAVAVPLHLWAGPHVFGQLLTASDGVSYASPWRAVYTVLDLGVAEPSARAWVARASAVLCVVLAVVLWRRLPGTDSGPQRLLLVLVTAYALGAAYVLPWYALPMWAALAWWVADGGRAPRLLRALVVQGAVVAIGYVPGRVRIPEDMATVTLAWRMVVVPLVTAIVWLLVLRPARRPGRGRRGSARG